jgi:chitinase
MSTYTNGIFFCPNLDLYRRINALKTRNSKLKILLAIGGWNMESYAFSTMVHDNLKRRNFIFDSIK